MLRIVRAFKIHNILARIRQSWGKGPASAHCQIVSDGCHLFIDPELNVSYACITLQPLGRAGFWGRRARERCRELHRLLFVNCLHIFGILFERV